MEPTNNTPSEEPYSDSEEDPKTASMPDPTIYPSEKLQEILDVGELPEELSETAWTMLKRHTKAFGFDGHLGHHLANICICTKEGAEQISLPMYASSPAK